MSVVVVALWRIRYMSWYHVYLYPGGAVVDLMWRRDPLVLLIVLRNPPSMVLVLLEQLGSLSIVRVRVHVMTGLYCHMEVYSVVKCRGV